MKYTPEFLLSKSDPDGDCLIWRGTVNSNGYPMLWFGRTPMTGQRWIMLRRLGADPASVAADGTYKRMRAWPSCGDSRCIADDHIKWGTVEQHRAWLRKQGRTRRLPSHVVAITVGRRRNCKITMEIADAIRAERAAGARRLDVAQRYGLNKDMVTKITTGKNWRACAVNSSVFNLAHRA